MENFKRSTSRDFRINGQTVEAILNIEESEEEEEEEEGEEPEGSEGSERGGGIPKPKKLKKSWWIPQVLRHITVFPHPYNNFVVLKSYCPCIVRAVPARAFSITWWKPLVVFEVLRPDYTLIWELGCKASDHFYLYVRCLSWKIEVRSCDEITETDQGKMAFFVHTASSPCFLLVLLSVVSFCMLCVGQNGACFNGERVGGRCQCNRGWTGVNCEHCDGRVR